MNHKRRRPKKQRAGCLMCKPWKCNGAGTKMDYPPDRKRIDARAEQELKERFARAFVNGVGPLLVED